MSTADNQGKDSKRSMRTIALVLILATLLIIAVLLFGSSQTFYAELSLILAIVTLLCTILSASPKIKADMVWLFKSVPVKRLFQVSRKHFFKVLFFLSLAFNIILVSIISWPSFSKMIRGSEQQPPTSASLTGTSQAQTSAMSLYMHVMNMEPYITDTLSKPDNLGWDVWKSSIGSCQFQGGAYYATATPPANTNTACIEWTAKVSELALQADVTLVNGSSGGIVFRCEGGQEESFYTFYVTADGIYSLEKSSPINNYTILSQGSSPEIKTSTNQLTVITKGTNFSLYVNKHYVGSGSDNSYTTGFFGVFTLSANGSLAQAKITNLSVWKLG